MLRIIMVSYVDHAELLLNRIERKPQNPALGEVTRFPSELVWMELYWMINLLVRIFHMY